ncbi:hypothetical protein [Aurantibacillus circumpalustris]|uniref:hypothetical protein n=1 Tax=Aurantibacillus circumpalustris TaxID=3036359 RepID=UPI00295BA927|nr:hypothetical protein [Aurantibacillus circumpalustris]
MENLTHILIFKTNIKSEEDKTHIAEFLSNNGDIEEWSVDCDDIDCVLRIVSHKLDAEGIIKLINQKGFRCEELTE